MGEVVGLRDEGLERDQGIEGGGLRGGCWGLGIMGEREGEVREQAFVDEGNEGVDSVRGEDGEGREKEGMGEGLESAGLMC